MQIERELAVIKPKQQMLLTIGVFDGVHVGHQRLLTLLRDEARRKELVSGVITFKSHPQVILSNTRDLRWLIDLDTRIEMIRGLGIDIVLALTFTPELAQITAREFLQLLKDKLMMCGLMVGPDFALGRNREGDLERLRLLGKEMDFSIKVVPPVLMNGEVISSSVIRQALASGEVEKVEKLLGRTFVLSGQVVYGDKRGSKLGFPTTNLDVSPDQALPGDGVYVTISHVGDESLPSVTNIGLRPTFDGRIRLVETHILDYSGDLYGRTLSIEFLGKLRDEKRFGSVEALLTQMKEDIRQARIVLAKPRRKQGAQIVR